MPATAKPCSSWRCCGLAGRGGPLNREDAVKLLASSAKLGNPKAAYNLALLYLGGQTLPQDVKHAAELFGSPPMPATRRPNTRSRPSTRRAPACRRTSKRRSGCCRRLRSPTMSMPRSNMPSRCSTAPARQERARGGGAVAQGGKQNNPIAQNRLAQVLVERTGRAGRQDRGPQMAHRRQNRRQGRPELDEALAQLSPEDRAKAEAAARKWLGAK